MEGKDFLIKILDSKERRARHQKSLIGKYQKSLISFTLNIPGREKDNKTYRAIHREGVRLIEQELVKNNYKLVYKEEVEKETGREAYLIVDIHALSLKKLAIGIEESSRLARVFDIDVFDKDHKQIGRESLGEPSRKCLVCSRDARVCIRERIHSYQDLISEINHIWLNYKNK